MKKSSLTLVFLTVVVLAASAAGVSSASHCDRPRQPGSKHDPFGSCEQGGGFSTKGNLKCGSGNGWVPIGGSNGVPMLAKVAVDANKGAQVCNDGTGNPTAAYIVQGRVTVYKDPSGNLVIAADGDKNNSDNNLSNASGWNRTDVRPNDSSCKVRLRRGQASGNYWNTSSGAPTNPDAGSGPQDTCREGYLPF